MQFKDNDTLQLKLASGELLNWSITTNSPKELLILPKRLQLLMLTLSIMPMFLKMAEYGIGDGQGHVLLSIQIKKSIQGCPAVRRG